MNYNINKNVVCNNCGKFGHTQKQCSEPITSLGIICLKLNEEDIYKILNYSIAYDSKKDILKTLLLFINYDCDNNKNDKCNEYKLFDKKLSDFSSMLKRRGKDINYRSYYSMYNNFTSYFRGRGGKRKNRKTKNAKRKNQKAKSKKNRK